MGYHEVGREVKKRGCRNAPKEMGKEEANSRNLKTIVNLDMKKEKKFFVPHEEN